jgi:hypothetical protein
MEAALKDQASVSEKLNDAVLALTIGKGRIRERLATAVDIFQALERSDFPELGEFRHRYDSFWKILSDADEAGGGFHNAIGRMSEDKAGVLALEILEIASQYDDLVKGRPAARQSPTTAWQRTERT